MLFHNTVDKFPSGGTAEGSRRCFVLFIGHALVFDKLASLQASLYQTTAKFVMDHHPQPFS